MDEEKGGMEDIASPRFASSTTFNNIHHYHISPTQIQIIKGTRHFAIHHISTIFRFSITLITLQKWMDIYILTYSIG